MFVHGELYSQHAAVGDCRELSEVAHELGVASHAPETASPMTQSRGWRVWLAIAAAIVGVAAVSSWVTSSFDRLSRTPAGVAQSPASENVKSVARITASRNCLWAKGGNEIGYGSRLAVGQRLNLSTGLVEITFDNGGGGL